jgi:hypothetical protein
LLKDQNYGLLLGSPQVPVAPPECSVFLARNLVVRVQVSMESNGKGVSIDGVPLPYNVGEVDFGEPGTNGQHSFYQLIHQGRIVPCDFIGIIKSQQSVYLKGEHRRSDRSHLQARTVLCFVFRSKIPD